MDRHVEETWEEFEQVENFYTDAAHEVTNERFGALSEYRNSRSVKRFEHRSYPEETIYQRTTTTMVTRPTTTVTRPRPTTTVTRPCERLSWTPDLHRKFMRAVEILGGEDYATPKSIQSLMRIPEITLPQIKSRLQLVRRRSRS
ncbi:hypothetical protein C1H46_015739 [Malus baccata]|uniref:Myb-like domain-containing protein n=1 Tax=Malus baccata TaxID=106549 RepID=A0A540MIA0_MALBA|nr:hypothetical protein C1H46_015739 [Malus baccata]